MIDFTLTIYREIIKIEKQDWERVFDILDPKNWDRDPQTKQGKQDENISSN